MELEQQLQVIIDDAANFGVSPKLVEQAIAPVLGLVAAQLQHLEYFVLQNLQGDWVVTTIANPQQERKVIYAFVSVQDAAIFGDKTNPDLMAMPISIVQLLFRVFALPQLDSVIFLEDSRHLNQGIKIERQDLAESIQQQIEQLKIVPPDIA